MRLYARRTPTCTTVVGTVTAWRTPTCTRVVGTVTAWRTPTFTTVVGNNINDNNHHHHHLRGYSNVHVDRHSLSVHKLWVCLHGLESRSERRFGTWFKTWLGSWFELRSFTWATNAFPITIRNCALRVIFCSYYAVRARWLTMRLCMASARIFKMQTHESRSETALRLHGLESGFLGGSRSKTPFFRVSKRVSKAWFETAVCLHGLKSGFQIRKRPNHVLKRLSERDSSPCKHTHCWHSLDSRMTNVTCYCFCYIANHYDNN